MTTDHMELRTAAALRWPVPGTNHTGPMTTVNVSQIALAELLAKL